jgi:2-polyprenyl-3-methyl-5-hydroxy-6-metoxy-1,4-benzoquinol methylase
LCDADDFQVVSRLAGPWNFRARTVICKVCGLLYRNPQWDEAEAAEFYRSVSRYYTWSYGLRRLAEDQHGAQLQEAARRLRWVRQYLSLPARILDVGAGSGAFVEVALEAGADAVGIELDEDAVASAQQRGIPMLLTSLESAEFERESFDAITTFHVLEHVSDLRAFLQKAHRLLYPGGVLLVEVPDTARIRIRPKDFFMPEHNWHFTPRTLKLLLADQGWGVDAIAEEDIGAGYTADMLFAVARKVDGGSSEASSSDPEECLRTLALLRAARRAHPRSLGGLARDILTVGLGPRRGFRVVRLLCTLRSAASRGASPS